MDEFEMMREILRLRKENEIMKKALAKLNITIENCTDNEDQND